MAKDHYATMYDIEDLTPFATPREVSSEIAHAEQLIRSNRCDVVPERIGPQSAEGKMLLAALLMKDLEFQRANPRYVYNSPKTCALEELCEYLGLPQEVVARRMRVEEPVAEAWVAAGIDPANAEHVTNFYSTTDAYLYELMAANNIMHTLATYDMMAKKLSTLPVRSILDFGGGVGTLSIILNRLAYAVTFADLPGPCFDFAKARFERRGIDIPLLDLTTDELGYYDAILCTEVVEHVNDPVRLLQDFHELLGPGGLLIVSESCEHLDFCSHLPSNAQYGGENFEPLMRKIGFKKILSEPEIPQQFFIATRP